MWQEERTAELVSDMDEGIELRVGVARGYPCLMAARD